ncbi:MAG: 2-oxoacid:acceptor oxidoreductase subunit alpha [Acidimicrobiia bacterium]|nr:2-oxoacid:acceptor oxidoreductase subunit alpha [Acidimicrobiia bacterium]
MNPSRERLRSTVPDDSTAVADPRSDRPAHKVEHVVVRFAGDSGDGMQLTGDRFTLASAIFGNDLVTFPSFPAEIRAPAGTLAGVSSFQVHFSDSDIHTPGDKPNVLVAMNPAALSANVGDLPPGGTVIVNIDAFDERNLQKAGYETNPLEDGSLDAYVVYPVPMTTITVEVAKETGAKPREAERSKNFFALGLVSWMYSRPLEPTIRWNEEKFGRNRTVADSNRAALEAGWNFGETTEVIADRYEVSPAPLAAGEYRSINGNTATAYGIITAGQLANLPVFLASYPITPASDILHELARHKNFGVRTMQAEDEIAAVGAALGAAFGGHLGVTTTSGPGLDLKSETLGLAVQLEIPMLIVDVQRGGPSTGLPTKTEQADLLAAMFGRHGESPIPILAARTPGDCFYAAVEAARIAIGHMTPVILLTDGYLANGSEPWLIPDPESLDAFPAEFVTEPNGADGQYLPYLRDGRYVRPWALPGTPGLEHRIGGIEHEDGTGNVSYDPANHAHMVEVRAAKVARIADDIPDAAVEGDQDADILVIGWGSTYGSIRAGVEQAAQAGARAAHVHLRHLNPFPKNLGALLGRYDRVLAPEMNRGQLAMLLRSRFLEDVQTLSKMEGSPFLAEEIAAKIQEIAEARS